MKTFKLLVFGMMLMLAGSAQGQLSVDVHIGTPPAWGPSGYNDVRYYYLPDVEAYYDVQTSRFIYISGNRWVRRSYLPTRYRNYDLYNGYKVVMSDYRGNSPYRSFRHHKMKYARGYRGAEQRNNGDRDNRYNDNRRKQYNQPNKNVERRVERSQVRNVNQNHERRNNNGNEHGNDKNKGHDNDKGNRNRK